MMISSLLLKNLKEMSNDDYLVLKATCLCCFDLKIISFGRVAESFIFSWGSRGEKVVSAAPEILP